MSGYTVEITHPGLGRSYVVKGNDLDIVRARAEDKIRQFDQQWQRHLAAEERRENRDYKQGQQEEAKDLTNEAQEALEELENILAKTLSVDDRVDFDALLDKTPHGEPEPARPDRQPARPSAPGEF